MPCNSVYMRISCTLSAFSAKNVFYWGNPAAESAEKRSVDTNTEIFPN